MIRVCRGVDLLPFGPSFFESCTHSVPFFFFNDTATTEIYTLSLHDALPIYGGAQAGHALAQLEHGLVLADQQRLRSEEHTSELQSQSNLVCRLLLEKKKKSTIHDF